MDHELCYNDLKVGGRCYDRVVDPLEGTVEPIKCFHARHESGNVCLMILLTRS